MAIPTFFKLPGGLLGFGRGNARRVMQQCRVSMRHCSVWQVAALILTMCNFTEEVKCTEYMEHCPKLGFCGFVKQRLLILFDQVLCLDGADSAGMKAHMVTGVLHGRSMVAWWSTPYAIRRWSRAGASTGKTGPPETSTSAPSFQDTMITLCTY